MRWKAALLDRDVMAHNVWVQEKAFRARCWKKRLQEVQRSRDLGSQKANCLQTAKHWFIDRRFKHHSVVHWYSSWAVVRLVLNIGHL